MLRTFNAAYITFINYHFNYQTQAPKRLKPFVLKAHDSLLNPRTIKEVIPSNKPLSAINSSESCEDR